MTKRWYVERKSFHAARVPAIVCSDEAPSLDKTDNGSPSPYVRVEPHPEGALSMASLDQLFAHFNGEPDE